MSSPILVTLRDNLQSLQNLQAITPTDHAENAWLVRTSPSLYVTLEVNGCGGTVGTIHKACRWSYSQAASHAARLKDQDGNFVESEIITLADALESEISQLTGLIIRIEQTMK